MNYTNNVKCDDIKPLERKWFRYLVRQIDYESVKTLGQCKANDMDAHIDHFTGKYGISRKILYYYMTKWIKIGIFAYDDENTGTFSSIIVVKAKLDIEIPSQSHIKNNKPHDRYLEIIPHRVQRQLYSACWQPDEIEN